MACKELVDQYLETHGPTLKATTLHTYTDSIELRLLPKFGGTAINELSQQSIAKAFASWRTQARRQQRTRHPLFHPRWAEAQKFLPKHSNPCPDIKRYKTSKKERFLTRVELKRLGAYSLSSSPFHVLQVALFGCLGYIFLKLGCEGAPFPLGLVLGPQLEEYFRRAMQLSGGEFSIFLESPISLALLGTTAVNIPRP